MVFDNDRESLRRMYVDAWKRDRDGLPLEPLQAAIVDVVREHPEYHTMLEEQGPDLERNWTPDDGATNPFLHMGMHLAIREQVATNRPPGIAVMHRQLADKFNGAHEAEHQMMESLGAVLWNAQRQGVLPDDEDYMQDLKRRFDIKN